MSNQNPAENQQETSPVVPVVITASMILNMLKSGKDRPTIIKELKLTTADARLIFSSPSLKGIKVVRPSNIQFVDDMATVEENTVEEESAIGEEENTVEEETTEVDTTQPAPSEETVEEDPVSSETPVPAPSETPNNPWNQTQE